MLLCNTWFLDVIEPLFGIDVIMPTCVGLVLLCIGCRTFSVGTDVLVPMYGCTDVIVQYIGLVLRVLEPVVWQWCCYAIGIHRCFESTGYSCISIFQFQFRDSEQNSIPYVWEIVLSNVFVQGGIVNPDKHGFLDGSCHIVLFSTNDLEIVH